MAFQTVLALPVCHSFTNSQTKIHEITHYYSAKVTLCLNNMQHILNKSLLILAKRAKLTITKKKTSSPLNRLKPYWFYQTFCMWPFLCWNQYYLYVKISEYQSRGKEHIVQSSDTTWNLITINTPHLSGRRPIPFTHGLNRISHRLHTRQLAG